jgi:hypothetical protein
MESQAPLDRNRTEKMIRKLLIAAVVLLTLLPAYADKPIETLDELKARAAASDKHKQADLYIELAKREAETADETYNANADQAKALFEDSAKSAELSSQAALESNHKLKQIEIKLRELAHRMSDIRKTWAFEDRAPLDPAIQRVEAARTKLLDRMFQK